MARNISKQCIRWHLATLKVTSNRFKSVKEGAGAFFSSACMSFTKATRSFSENENLLSYPEEASRIWV